VRAWRETARALIPRFAEVQLACPAPVCATRERAVRWRLIGCPHAPPRGRAATPDVACVYEAPLCPELILYTDVEGPWSSAAAVVALARRLHAASAEGLWTVSADR
jgi:adenylylsulfate kinase-like enzyme